jgi:group I intron endonuclease
MAGLIYYITSKANGRVYVGSTTRSAKQRWAEHMHYLRKGTHHSKHLQRVYAKYGVKDLEFSIAAHCDDSEPLLDVEQRHIDMHDGRCMNTAPVSDSIYAAHAANRGRVMSEEEKAKRSEAAKKAISEGRAIRGPWSEERKAAHAIRLTGRKMPKVSQESKDNISKGLRMMHALKGTSAKPKGPDLRNAFVAAESAAWRAMAAQGKSFREIERLTGRCRRVIARACKEAV